MAVPKSNQDKQIPWTKETTGIGEVVHVPCFDNTIHIFWGPGQLTDPDITYTPPDHKAWHSGEPLMIPQVVRFIYSSSDTYDDQSYPKPGGGGPTEHFFYVTDKKIILDPGGDALFNTYLIIGNVDHVGSTFYSERNFVFPTGGGAPKSAFGQFTVGMKFKLLPGIYGLPIRYFFANPDGVGDGFFATKVGGGITPVSPE